jgi:hypothetical protein
MFHRARASLEVIGVIEMKPMVGRAWGAKWSSASHGEFEYAHVKKKSKVIQEIGYSHASAGIGHANMQQSSKFSNICISHGD